MAVNSGSRFPFPLVIHEIREFCKPRRIREANSQS
jgi:hypothetical protein